MQHQEKQLTPAQAELLDFITTRSAAEIYRSLSTVVILTISQHTRRHLDEPAPEPPTPKALEALYFTLEIMERLVDIIECGDR